MAYVKHNFQPMDILHASEMNEIDEQVYQNSIQSYAKIVTQAEYDALSEAEKNSNVVYYVSDAPFDSPNVVTLTRAEYDALSEADKMDGRFYYITDDEEVATSLVVQTNQNNPDTVPSSAVLYNETSSIRESLSKSQIPNVVSLPEIYQWSTTFSEANFNASYVAPNDGYLYIAAAASSSVTYQQAYTTCLLMGSIWSGRGLFFSTNGTSSQRGGNCVFVKKGMHIQLYAYAGSPIAMFCELT